MKKMNMKWLSLVMVVLALMSVFAPMAFAETESIVEVESGMVDSAMPNTQTGPAPIEGAPVETNALLSYENAPETEEASKMIFEPMNFVKNLSYMGVGMLGIFIVIGVIIIAVVVLNKVTAPKKKDNE